MTRPTVSGKRLDPPVKGTTRVLATTDTGMATAVNHSVDAIRELQVIVTELIEEVRTLKGDT